MAANELAKQLQSLIRGLWLPSETEAPWTLPTWTLSGLEGSEIRRVLHRGEGVPITEITLDELMQQIERRSRGYGDEGKAIAQQHQALAIFLKDHCAAVHVFRVGTVTVDILLVGETTNGQVVLQTQSVET
jgi:hypothetical protein